MIYKKLFLTFHDQLLSENTPVTFVWHQQEYPPQAIREINFYSGLFIFNFI